MDVHKLIIPSFLLLASLLISIPTYADNEKLKFKVLENTSTEDCAYIGTVSIQTRYKKKYFTNEFAQLVVRASYDGATFERIHATDVERGRGRIVLNFNVGECAKDLRVVLRN